MTVPGTGKAGNYNCRHYDAFLELPLGFFADL